MYVTIIILRKQFFPLRFLVKMTRSKQNVKKKDVYMDILQPSRYKPSDLEQMAKDTKFTKGSANPFILCIVWDGLDNLHLTFQTKYDICTEPLNRSAQMAL